MRRPLVSIARVSILAGDASRLTRGSYRRITLRRWEASSSGSALMAPGTNSGSIALTSS